MNNNKGVNLIALIVIIIIMIILAAIAMRNSIDAHNNALEARALEENRHVVDAVQNRYGSYMTNPTVSPLVGVKAPDSCKTIDEIYDFIIDYLHSKGKLSALDKESIEKDEAAIKKLLDDNKGYLEYTRILEHSNLSEIGLESMPINATYVVNYFGTNVVGPIY